MVFGTAVTIERDDGTTATFELVGEDEADPAAGRIAWTTPVARALLGGEVGEVRALPTGPVEILAIAAIAERSDGPVSARSSTAAWRARQARPKSVGAWAGARSWTSARPMRAAVSRLP